jgi:Raf kinase inhibitor-like YbhB/YbcL family protein
MQITSPDFENGSMLPKDFTCDGPGDSPEVHIHEVPGAAKSLALIVDDPDAPGGTFTHWLLWNIDPQQGLVLSRDKIPAGAVEGRNSSGDIGWMAACPPPGHGEHRYHFKIYALDARLDVPMDISPDDLRMAIETNKLGEAEIVATYKR